MSDKIPAQVWLEITKQVKEYFYVNMVFVPRIEYGTTSADGVMVKLSDGRCRHFWVENGLGDKWDVCTIDGRYNTDGSVDIPKLADDHAISGHGGQHSKNAQGDARGAC